MPLILHLLFKCCMGFSEMFVGGYQDGSIKIYDTRMSNGNSVILFDSKIPNAHGKYPDKYRVSHVNKVKSRRDFLHTRWERSMNLISQIVPFSYRHGAVECHSSCVCVQSLFGKQ